MRSVGNHIMTSLNSNTIIKHPCFMSKLVRLVRYVNQMIWAINLEIKMTYEVGMELQNYCLFLSTAFVFHTANMVI